MSQRRLIVTADDFGLDPAVNESVERAHLEGILTSASLMVGAPAAADAVARARRLPSLCVGLHLVVASGAPMLPASEIPALVDDRGGFREDLIRAGGRFFFDPAARRELAEEIRAQFEAFRATGLRLDHANAHRHLHLHPTIGRLLITIGRAYGLRAVRVPEEPLGALSRAGATVGERAVAGLHAPFAKLLRRSVARAGLFANDHLLGLAWSGGMTEERLLRLLSVLPAGVSELYLHPATARSPTLEASMPNYRHIEEFSALLSVALKRSLDSQAIALTTYSRLV